MLQHPKQQCNHTLTENGAITCRTTGSDCLDLFATIGALRGESEHEIETRFMRAFAEDADTATKLAFFARDIRGGLGERRVFRVILAWLATNSPLTIRKNMANIVKYGRFDDLLSLLDTPCEADAIAYIKARFHEDMDALVHGGEVSLLGKWLPSINASGAETVARGKKLARALEIDNASYRKALSALRARIGIIENRLREKDYRFDYAKQPSRAMFKYRRSFIRNDGEHYAQFMEKVAKCGGRFHADGIAPYELISAYLDDYFFHQTNTRPISKEEKIALNATWASLTDFTTEENVLVVVDTSRSMYFNAQPRPAAVALSLGLYFAEHNTGHFKNHFIEFSARPRLIKIKGDTFADRLRCVASFGEAANTNLQAVFDLILRTAVENFLPESELPQKLILISDMEFDACTYNASASNFENSKSKFASQGYRLPDIVFWNVASRNRHQPVTANEQGVTLVSGVTPRLFSMIASGTMSPLRFMTEILQSERYASITA